MELTRLSAPGKLFLFGEWSVLEGGQALLLPVKAGQRGLLRRSASDLPVLVVKSPEFSSDARTWHYEDGAWVEQGESTWEGLDVVGAVIKVASERWKPKAELCDLTISTQGLYLRGAAQPKKMGFGSSGSVAVLIAQALGLPEGRQPQEILEVALHGHRQAQDWRGSGADVATSAWGKTISYSLPEAVGLSSRETGWLSPSVDVVGPCRGLRLSAVWSGQEADTRVLMEAMQAFHQSKPKAYKEKIALVSKAADLGVEAWKQQDVRGVIEAVRQSQQALDALGKAAKVDIIVDAHRLAGEVVESVGGSACAWKTSGAGGGDMALVWSANTTQHDAVMQALAEADFLSFPLV